MNDPLGLFDTQEGSDPLGLFAEDEYQATPIEAGLESLISVGTNSLAQIPAGIAGLFPGTLDERVGRINKVSEALTYKPITKRGQEWTENTGEVLNKPVEWLGNAGEFVAGNEGRLVGEIAGNFAIDLLPVGGAVATSKRAKPSDTPTGNAKLDALDQIQKAKEAAVVEQPTMYSDTAGTTTVGPMPRIPEDPAVTALAQQRATQMEADAKGTMYVGNDGVASKVLSDPVQSSLFDVEAAKMSQAMELEAQSKAIEEPVGQQRDMFENPDQMRFDFDFKEDPLGLFDGVDRPQAQGIRIPKGQRGAIDLKALEEGFNKFKHLEDGTVLAIRGTGGDARVEAFTPRGDKISEVRLSPTEWANPTPDSNLESTWTNVDPAYRGKGLAEKMYQFGAEVIGDITPSKTQTMDGAKMWEGFEKRGVSQGMKIPRGQRGAVDVNALLEGLFGAGTKGVDGFRKLLRGSIQEKVQAKKLITDRLEATGHFQWQVGDQVYSPKTGFTYKITGKTANSRTYEPQYMYELLDGDHTYSGAKGMFNAESAHEGMQKIKSVPKGQKGALDFNAISKSIGTLLGRPDINPSEPANPDAKPGKAIPTREEIVQRAIPGLADKTKDFIPEDPVVADVIEQARKEKDSNLKFTWMKSGSTLTAAQTGSTVIKATGRFFQNAVKRSERNIRNTVRPVEELFRKLPKNEITELAEVFKKEMFNRAEFTVAELQQAGFSPKQIEAYSTMRTMFTKALETQNASRTAMGLEPITAKEAYLSSRWQGDWRAMIYDTNGKLVWAVAERSKRAVANAMDYLETKGVKIDRKKSQIEYRQGAGQRQDLQNSYSVMLKLLDKDDPRIPAIQSAMEEAMANDAFSALAQKKHFDDKGNVRGFIGDRPWKDRTKDSYEMFQQQFQYAKNAFSWAELQKASSGVKEILNDPEIQANQKKSVNYARNYGKQNLGYGEAQYIGALEKEAAQFLGTDRQKWYEAVGTMKNYFLTTKLSMSLGYTMASLLQPTMAAAWHARLTNDGFKHNAAKSLALSLQDGMAGYLKYVADDVTGKDVKMRPMSKIGTEALKYAEENGIVSRSIYDEAAGLGRNRFAEGLQNTLGLTVSHPEKISRSIAFMSFVHHLDQSGAFKGDNSKLFQKAEEYLNISMTDYRRGERPMMFEKMGVTGAALGTLQTFKFNYFNQLYTLGKFAAEGNKRPLATFLGLQVVVGGAISFPMLEELEAAWMYGKDLLGHDEWKEVADISPKTLMLKHLPDWASHGAVSKLTGANMSTRFDASNVADLAFDQTFPFISDIANQVSKLGAAAMNPNESTVAEAAFAVTPPGLAGLVETGMDAFKVGDRREDGTQIYKNPKDIVAQDAKFARTEEQEDYRKLGLRELEESKLTEQQWRQNINEKQRDERKTLTSRKFFDAIMREDKADTEKLARQYIELGGNPGQLKATINQQALKANVLPSKLALIQAKGLGALQKAQRMNP